MNRYVCILVFDKTIYITILFIYITILFINIKNSDIEAMIV